MVELLKKDESRWSQFFQNALAVFERGEYQQCAEIISSGFGCMGSLNDLVLGQTTDSNGKFQWKLGYEEMDNSYQEMLSALYPFAQGLRRVVNKHFN